MSGYSFSEDQIIQLIVFALVVAHLGVLVWYWFRPNLTPVLTLNLMVSGGVMAYWAPRLGELGNYDEMVWAFVAFECAVLATSIAGLATRRVPRLLILAAFGGNAVLSAAALHFLLTFTITRLM